MFLVSYLETQYIYLGNQASNTGYHKSNKFVFYSNDETVSPSRIFTAAFFGLESVITSAEDAELEELNALNQSSLQIAAARGHLPVVKALLGRNCVRKSINISSHCRETNHHMSRSAQQARLTYKSLFVMDNLGECQATFDGIVLRFAWSGLDFVTQKIVDTLLEAGAGADARNLVNQTYGDKVAKILESLLQTRKDMCTELVKIKL
jgi:hypothetical protein